MTKIGGMKITKIGVGAHSWSSFNGCRVGLYDKIDTSESEIKISEIECNKLQNTC